VYLTGPAPRESPLTDVAAIKTLVDSLKESEVVRGDAHLSIPTHDAALKIWFERKMVLLRLNAGDVLRRHYVRLTPSGRTKIIFTVPDR
jgi:hypothetical protein